MAVEHLAHYDLSQEFKRLGYSTETNAWLSVKQINQVVKEYYPDIGAKLGNIKVKDMVNLSIALGLPLRTQTKMKQLTENHTSDSCRKTKMTNVQKKLLRYLKHLGYVEKKIKILSDKMLYDVIAKHFKMLEHKFPYPTFKDAPAILKSMQQVREVKAQEYNKTLLSNKTTLKSGEVDVSSKEFLKTWEWKTLRYEVLLEQGAKCRCCGADKSTGAIMNVDHIKPRRTHPELALVKSNLQVLCGDCNMGKGSWDTTPW